jgi:competence protein ComEA
MKIKSLVLTSAIASLLAFNVMAAEPATQPNATVVNKEAEQLVKKQEFIEKININTASAEQLAAALNGVGAAKAQAIVQFREQNGPFKSVEELGQVKGIGEATLAKNKDKISIE